MKNNVAKKVSTKKVVEEEEVKQYIYIDSKDNHIDDNNIFAIHPSKLNFLTHHDKEIFDGAVIQNCATSSIKTLGLFYLVKVLKPLAKLEVYIDQPISVMQKLDASEIEANAKLAGFVDIEESDYEKVTKDGDREHKVKSILLIMTRPETLKKNISVEIEQKVDRKENSPNKNPQLAVKKK